MEESYIPIKIKNIINNEYNSIFYYVNEFNLSTMILELWETNWKQIEITIYENKKDVLIKHISYIGDKKYYKNLNSIAKPSCRMELWVFIKTI